MTLKKTPQDKTTRRSAIEIRQTRPEDFPGIIELTRRVYPDALPYGEDQLSSHVKVFPEGQLVASEVETGRICGMAASLIVLWDDYDVGDDWRDFTDHGYFTNHDPAGHTLYGAEVMVDPRLQGRGLGKRVYSARRRLAQGLGLRRIRAGARLRDYHKWADRLTPRDYVEKVAQGEIGDRTLSFQIKQGFRPLAVVGGYLPNDPSSLGYAAVIEWLNPEHLPDGSGAAGTAG